MAGDEWIPMFTLPNIAIQEAIEMDGVALVSLQDSRLRALATDHEKFATYLDGFTTEFGQEITPSVILVRHDKFDLYRSAEGRAGARGPSQKMRPS